jgi:hypothetical protein
VPIRVVQDGAIEQELLDPTFTMELPCRLQVRESDRLPVRLTSGSGDSAGPARTSPVGLKREP